MNIQPIIDLIGGINQECTCMQAYKDIERHDPQCEFHSIGGDEIEAAVEWIAERAPHWKVVYSMGRAPKAVPGVFFDVVTAERVCSTLNRNNAPIKYHVQAFAPTMEIENDS